MRQNLREIFVGIFHGSVDQFHIFDFAAADGVDGEEAGMAELLGAFPSGENLVGMGKIGGEEFDAGLAEFGIAEFGAEDGAMVGAAAKFAQLIFVVDDLAFPPFPKLTHR